MGHGKSTKYLISMIANGGHLGAIKASVKHLKSRLPAENPYAAFEAGIEAEENLAALAEMPLFGLRNSHEHLQINYKRSKDILKIREYLHAIRVAYDFDTTAAFTRAYQNKFLWPYDDSKFHLPNLWSNGGVWYIRAGKLRFLRVGKPAGRLGFFGF